MLQSFAQTNERKGYDKEISFSGDNDVLAFKGTDRYYTNGLFLKYATLSKKTKPAVSKRINEWEIGQMIFTGYKREILALTEIDRPIAGYLYGKFSQSTFINKNKLFTWGLSIGSTGDMSLAKQVINDFHPFVKINSDWWGWIWNYQIKGEIGINAHGKYAFSLMDNKDDKHFKVTSITNGTIGTSFTNISQSVLFQLGASNKMFESGYWNARIDRSSAPLNKHELFLFYQPEIAYQAYDATIQGGMFTKDKGRITWPVKPFVFTHHFGVFFSNKRYSLSLQEFFETKRAKFQFDNHAYGRIIAGYRFR